MRWFRRLSQMLLVLLLSCGAVSRGEQTRHDGNWWIAKDDLFKLTYVSGLFDGVIVGRDLAAFGSDTKQSHDGANTTMILNSFTATVHRLMSNVTVGQVVAGLDDFYHDYKNRSIESTYATEVVLEGTAGMPKQDIENWVEHLRQIASKY